MKENHRINMGIQEKFQKIIKENGKNIYIFLVLFILILIMIIIYMYAKLNISNVEEIQDNMYVETNMNDEIDLKSSEIEEEKIIIYITGEVLNPGVYELNEEGRIKDVIELAGGLTQAADLTNVNLAYKLSDGQKIKIPCINDENTGNYIFENIDDYVINGYENQDSKVNINKANKTELMKISGIGESTAEKIIKYREENGKFKNIEDIKNVSGIGESKFNKIKDGIKIK